MLWLINSLMARPTRTTAVELYSSSVTYIRYYHCTMVQSYWLHTVRASYGELPAILLRVLWRTIDVSNVLPMVPTKTKTKQ